MQCNKKRITRRAGSKWQQVEALEKVHHTLWALSFFFFLIVLPWFGHVFRNKGRFGHKRKLPGFFYFLIWTPHLNKKKTENKTQPRNMCFQTSPMNPPWHWMPQHVPTNLHLLLHLRSRSVRFIGASDLESKLLIPVMVIPPLLGNPYNGYIIPYYILGLWPSLQETNGNLAPRYMIHSLSPIEIHIPH